jgi:hypothetical protein
MTRGDESAGSNQAHERDGTRHPLLGVEGLLGLLQI